MVLFQVSKICKEEERVAEVKAKKSGLNAHQGRCFTAKANMDTCIKKAKLDYETKLVNQIKTEPK